MRGVCLEHLKILRYIEQHNSSEMSFCKTLQNLKALRVLAADVVFFPLLGNHLVSETGHESGLST